MTRAALARHARQRAGAAMASKILNSAGPTSGEIEDGRIVLEGHSLGQKERSQLSNCLFCTLEENSVTASFEQIQLGSLDPLVNAPRSGTIWPAIEGRQPVLITMHHEGRLLILPRSPVTSVEAIASQPSLNTSSDAFRTAIDMMASVQYARNQDAAWVAVIATGRTAVEALRAANLISVDALVLVSPRMTANDQPDDLRGHGEAKFFAAGTMDSEMHKNVSQLRNRSIGWAMYVQLPTAEQGTDLLVSSYASQVSERITMFVAEQRAIAEWSMTPARRQTSVGNEVA